MKTKKIRKRKGRERAREKERGKEIEKEFTNAAKYFISRYDFALFKDNHILFSWSFSLDPTIIK